MKRLILIIFVVLHSIYADTTIAWKTLPQDIKLINGKFWQDTADNVQKKLTWEEAERYCEDLHSSYGGIPLDHFRLPTSKELKGLVPSPQLEFRKRFGYWANRHFTKKHKKFASFVQFWQGGISTNIRTLLTQNVRCVHEADGLPVDKQMSVKEIAGTLRQKHHVPTISKPQRQPYMTAEPLHKGEFEKSVDFLKRVEKQKKKVAEYNRKIDEAYAKAYQAWKSKRAAAAEASKQQNTQKHIMTNAMFIKYGNPVIRSVQYDADAETFTITIVSQKTKAGKRAEDIGKNLIVSPVKAKKGLFDIVKMEDISPQTTTITLDFHKRKFDFVFGENIGVRYISPRESFRLQNEYKFSMERGDRLEVFLPRIMETCYRPPFRKYLENSTILLQNSAALTLTFQVNVPMEDARKFKEMLLAETFSPTVLLHEKNGTFTVTGIEEIADPQYFVAHKRYEEALGNIETLKSFIANCHIASLADKAKRELDGLQNKLSQTQKEQIVQQQERQKAEEARKKSRYEAYHARKKVGDKVCMKGKMLFFMQVKITGYVESVNGDKIQIRIVDTEGQSPRYNGVTLKPDSIIWDDFYKWKGC